MKLCWPAPERNKAPIVEVLSRVLPGAGKVLEVASGSGQHVVHFARSLPALEFQPSEADPENLTSVRAWVAEAQLPNLREPLYLDVLQGAWGVATFQGIFNANMIHITPWACAEALFAGVGVHLANEGVFVLYGPFRIASEHTAPSNQAFDESLRSRDARWGVRDVEAVLSLAAAQGLQLAERIPMPANNQCLVFART